MLSLIALANGTRAHQVLHEQFHVRKMKIMPQPVQHALNPLVTVVMNSQHDILEQRRGRRYV